jgi:hypothetical protein
MAQGGRVCGRFGGLSLLSLPRRRRFRCPCMRDEAIQFTLRHSGMRRRDKIAELFCAGGAGPESIPRGIRAGPWIPGSLVSLAPRNDEPNKTRPTFPRRDPRPSDALSCPRKSKRAQGMPGVRRARSCVCSVESTRVSHHGYAGTARHSPRNGLNDLFHALPGDRAFCHRHRRNAEHCRQLDVSVETSEPRGFVVRLACARLSHRSAHRIPRPTSVTIAKRPFEMARDANRDSPASTAPSSKIRKNRN